MGNGSKKFLSQLRIREVKSLQPHPQRIVFLHNFQISVTYLPPNFLSDFQIASSESNLDLVT